MALATYMSFHGIGVDLLPVVESHDMGVVVRYMLIVAALVMGSYDRSESLASSQVRVDMDVTGFVDESLDSSIESPLCTWDID